MSDDILIVELGLDSTNDYLIERMKVMKEFREKKIVSNVACVIRGFDGDKRELFEVPEARAFCRRLVNLGFISYLDFHTTIATDSVPEPCRLVWGAFEVWLCGEGKMKKSMEVSIDLLSQAEIAVMEANEKSDKLIGEFKQE